MRRETICGMSERCMTHRGKTLAEFRARRARHERCDEGRDGAGLQAGASAKIRVCQVMKLER